MGDEVDGVGGAAGEDDLFGIVGVEKALDGAAGVLVVGGGAFGEAVVAAIGEGIFGSNPMSRWTTAANMTQVI